MAENRRNGPCPCGSGSKAKHCCFGIQQTGAVHCLPPELRKEKEVVLVTETDKADLRSLFDQVRYLSEMDTALWTRLRTLTPDMDRGIDALQDDDDDEFDRAPSKVVPEVNSMERRFELAQAVLTLRVLGRIPPRLAAIAVHLLVGEESTLVQSPIPESLAVLVGDLRRPAG